MQIARGARGVAEADSPAIGHGKRVSRLLRGYTVHFRTALQWMMMTMMTMMMMMMMVM